MNRSSQHSPAAGPWERRTQSLVHGIFVLALGLLAGVGAREAGSRPQQGDQRTAITLPAAHRDAILRDHRAMLTAMQNILDGAARLDPARIRASAQAAGTVAMVGADSAIRGLPENFRRRNAETRAAFDALAEAVRGFTARDTALVYLSRISQQCIACHAQYRFASIE